MKEYDKARVAYETAANSAELYLAPLQRLAEMYGELDDKAMQLRYLQKLDAISPLNVNRKVSLGEIHLAMGEPEKAEELFDKAVAQVTKEAMDGISSLSGRIAAIYADRDRPKPKNFCATVLRSRASSFPRATSCCLTSWASACASRAAGRTRSSSTNGPSRSLPRTRICITTWAWPLPKAGIFCRANGQSAQGH